MMHLQIDKGRIGMTTSLTIRMDKDLKTEAEQFFADIGMNLTTAITCYFKKCLAEGEIPFTFSRPGKKERMLEALREARRVADDPSAPACSDPDRLAEFLLQ